MSINLSELLSTAPSQIEARLLLGRITGWSATQIIAHPEWCLTTAQLTAYQTLHDARLRGEPIAYLLGEREFFGRVFQVSPAVLIPRPETELLVETALSLIQRQDSSTQPQILDLGTGSGAIAITLALEAPNAKVWASDFSEAALAVAQANAKQLKASIDWHLGDWWQAIPADLKFNVVVSNPPYIAQQDIHLQQGDLRFEPQQALTDGADGLQALRAIISGAHTHLRENAWLWLEHGYDQASSVRKLLSDAGFSEVQSLCDLAGIERISGGQFN